MLRHNRDTALKLYFGVAIGLLGLILVGAIYNGVMDSDFDRNRNQAASRAHFYRVVAGKDPATAPTVENKLALDLKAIKADQVKLGEFRGDTNAYAGVTDALGESPFDSSLCGVDCGPLTMRMYNRIREINDGNLDRVIKEDSPGRVHKLDVGFWFQLLMIWMTLGLLLLVVWTVQIYRRKNAVEDQYPSEYRLIHQLEEMSDALDPHDPRVKELRNTRDHLVTAMAERSMTGSNVKVSLLMKEARETLEAVEEGNRAVQE